MKRLWGLFSLIPLVAFSQSDLGDSFNIEEQAEEALLELTLDEDVNFDLSHSAKSFDSDNSDSLLFEVDAELDSLESALPWVPEKIGREELTDYIKDTAKSSDKKRDEDFAYDLSAPLEEVAYEPTLETVPKRTSKLFSRPKVVEAKESKSQEAKAIPKKNPSSATKAIKKPSLEINQKKLKEIKEKRKVLTNRTIPKKQGNKVILKSDPEITD